MASLRSRFLPKFQRSSSTKAVPSATSDLKGDGNKSRSKVSLLLEKSRQSSLSTAPTTEGPALLSSTPSPADESPRPIQEEDTPQTSLEEPRIAPAQALPSNKPNPLLTVEAPTPTPPVAAAHRDPFDALHGGQTRSASSEPVTQPLPLSLPRRQSLAAGDQQNFLARLLEPETPGSASAAKDLGQQAIAMLHRKIWVKRAGASATLIVINEDDLVDDVRDRILKKYGNSLGRSFDAPDVTLRIVPREHRDHSRRHSQGERILGPEEHMASLLDSFYAGDQTVNDALIIDVPRRSPNHSPRPVQYVVDNRPVESNTDYFSVIPAGQHSPHLPSNISVTSGHAGTHHNPPHSIAVLSTGQVPALPSPGGTRTTRHTHRPKFNRQLTTSPSVHSVIAGPQVHDPSNSHPNGIALPVAPNISSPSLPNQDQPVATPPPRPASPRVRAPGKNPKTTKPDAPSGLLNGAVPPINVLIVEDNIINLKLLEAFMKRLKVRWHTAMNGREAVQKWRNGGFHLVLMDIQLPVMNGLDATKEIRRLERVNNIGAFSYEPTTPGASGAPPGEGVPDKADDTLPNRSVFLSPVIIVALTASSLQSDRHEALAAGCNDFLTKPVNFVWLERKVMEWGCMQALIDFDGWRKWKDFSTPAAVNNAAVANNATPQSTKKHSPAHARANSATTPMAAKQGTPGSGGKAAPTPSPPTGKVGAMVDGSARHKRINSGSWGRASAISGLEAIRADSNEDAEA